MNRFAQSFGGCLILLGAAFAQTPALSTNENLPAPGERREPNFIIDDGGRGVISKMVFSPDGRLLASAAEDNAIVVREVGSNHQPVPAIIQTLRNDAPIRSFFFNPDGTLAMLSKTSKIKIWQPAEGTLLREWPLKGAGMAIELRPGLDPHVSVFSPDSTEIYLLNYMTGEKLMTYPFVGGGRLPNFSDDGRKLLVISCPPYLTDNAESLAVYDVVSGKPVRHVGVPRSKSATLGLQFALAAIEGEVRLFPYDRQQETQVYQVPGGAETDLDFWPLATNPAGSLIAAANKSGRIHIWETSTKRHLAILGTHTHYISSIVFNPVSGQLVSVDYDGNVYGWNMPSHAPLRN